MMLEVPIEVASKGIRLSETASGSSSDGDGDGDTIKSQKLSDGDKAEAGKGKRIARVSQEYIDRLLKHGTPKIPTFDFLDNHTGSNAPLLRAVAASSTASMKKFEADNADVLEQYRTKGYAEVEVEDFDVEELWIVKVARKSMKLASS